MKRRGKFISHDLIYRHIRADESGKLAAHCRHKMKYNRHGRPERTTKVKNIPERVSIHERPEEADGKRFGDWEMDTIVGKDGKGAIVTLTERSTNMLLMEKLPQGKHPEPLAKVVIRLLFPYRHTVRSITTDNGSEFCCHKMISKALAPKGTRNPNLVFFADSWRRPLLRATPENEAGLMPEYPKYLLPLCDKVRLHELRHRKHPSSQRR